MLDADRSYPGAHASPNELLQLAVEFDQTARLLAMRGRKGQPISRAPYRLAAIHAIELYLSAFLLHSGLEPCQVRALQHDLAARTDLSLARGLRLRTKTASHLRTMTAAREYLVSRYCPERSSSLSHPDRLSATLGDVGLKVGAAMSATLDPAFACRPDTKLTRGTAPGIPKGGRAGSAPGFTRRLS